MKWLLGVCAVVVTAVVASTGYVLIVHTRHVDHCAVYRAALVTALADPSSHAPIIGLTVRDGALIRGSRLAYQKNAAEQQSEFDAQLQTYDSWTAPTSAPGSPVDMDSIINARRVRPTPPDATAGLANWHAWATGTESPEALASQGC